MNETTGTTASPSRISGPLAQSHGGRAGWFRVAFGFSALATLDMGYQAWSIAQPSATATVIYPGRLAWPLAVGAVLFAAASLFALQRRARAALCLLLGYFIPAVAVYAIQGVVIPPSVLLVVSMLALIVATRRRAADHAPA